MKRLAVCLLPAALWAAPARYARVGDFDGDAQIQLRAADDWRAVEHNMPVVELAWLRTGASSRLEVELDDGGVLRLGANTLAELSDYTRLSTGQRVTLISLDHGLAYFTGAAEGNDALILVVPGAQVAIHDAAKVRLEGREGVSQIATAEGRARFSSPTAEFDLIEGQMARLDPAHPARFTLTDEIPALDTDRWCDDRDKLLASTTSAAHVAGLRYGLADLDANGVWIQAADLGAVWKPKVQAGWVPYRNGKWMWYDGLGYTWISADAWGWLPYHYGRWMLEPTTGWVWAPGKSTVFKPGDVYWLKSAKLVGWGPLAPGENWKPPDIPFLFLNANTTYAQFAPDETEIDPSEVTARPKEPLATATFEVALPSPPFPASRLDATRPVLQAGSTRIAPVVDGSSYAGAPEPEPVKQAQPPASVALPSTQPAEQPVTIVNSPPEGAVDPYYPVPVYTVDPIPVYTGIIVVKAPKGQTSSSATGKAASPGAGADPPPAKPPHEPPRKKPADADKPEK